MKTTLTIDKAGRIVIPKSLRDRLHLSEGVSLQLKANDEEIVLRPTREEGRLIRKRGIPVFQSIGTVTPAEIETIRNSEHLEREQRFLGRE